MARQRSIGAARGPVRYRSAARRLLSLASLWLALPLLASCGRAAVPATEVGGAAAVWDGAFAPPASRPQPQKVSVRLDWVPWAIQAPLHLAVERGWFAERGLDVELQDGNGSVIAVQTVGAGKFDLGYASLATMAMGRSEGLPVRSVAGFVRKGDLGMLFPEGAPIHSPRDMEGKSIIYTPGAFEAPFLDAFFRIGGTSRDRIDLITVDAAAKYQTYAAGRGDAVFGPVPYQAVLMQKARPSSALLFSDYGLLLPGHGLFATEDTINGKPEMLRGFVAAAVRGWEYGRDHPDEAMAAMLAQRPQASLEYEGEQRALEAYRDYLDTPRTQGKGLGWQSEEDWADALRAMADAGVVKADARPADYFTNEFIPTR